MRNPYRKAPKVLTSYVNSLPVDQIIIKSDVTVQQSFELELEKARQHLGIPLLEFNNMVGTRRWSHISPYQYGYIICKADVIAYYRVLTQTANAVENENAKKFKK